MLYKLIHKAVKKVLDKLEILKYTPIKTKQEVKQCVI